MSRALPVEPASQRAEPEAPSLQVRIALPGDAEAVAMAVRELLLELGGAPPSAPAMQATTEALIHHEELGALLVAEADGVLIGVLGASWQTAIHAAGQYALIQDLWVDPSWRSRAIGAALIAALEELAKERRMTRIEVGLPQERFAGLRATEAFYRANGFSVLGPRMRRAL